MDVAVVIVVFVAITAAIVLGVVAASQRRKQWAEFAASRGWRHLPKDRHFFRGLKQEPFNRGGSRVATNIAEGSFHGLPVRAFTYQYTTRNGENSTTHYHRVVQVPTPAVLPPLQVRSGWRLALTRDIQFESDQFNKDFDVRSPDERFAFRVVHPRFMAALLDGALGSYHYSIENGLFTLWKGGRLGPDQVDEMLGRLVHLIELVPNPVWADAGMAPPAIHAGSGPGPVIERYSITSTRG